MTFPVSEAQPRQAQHPCVLVMEDDAYLLRLYEKALTKSGFCVHKAETVDAARLFLQENHYGVFISDIHLGEEESVSLLRQEIEKLRQEGTEVIIVSGSAEYQYLIQDMQIDFFLEKPVAVPDLVTLVQRLI
ncbi:MAG: response regulator [Anaerolineae bacterium]|nr:response regulator [Anaerolineae bacterium]